MEQAIRAVFARLRVRAATLAVYDPENDQDDKTLRTALRLIEVLAESMKSGSGPCSLLTTVRDRIRKNPWTNSLLWR
jgi:hypothetical protein